MNVWYNVGITNKFSQERSVDEKKKSFEYTRIIKKVSRLFSYGRFYWQYTHETQVPFEVISSGCNALVLPFQQLLEGPMEVLLFEHVYDLRHSLFHLLSCLITIACELRE